MKLTNSIDLLKFENKCTHIQDLFKFYLELTKIEFIDKPNDLQLEHIENYKKILKKCIQLKERGELFDSDILHVNKSSNILKNKQNRLRLYGELSTNFGLFKLSFKSNIKEVFYNEFKSKIELEGHTTDEFNYQPPNSSSKSAIFKGFYNNERCYFKTFTIEGARSLEYEQRIYKYIKNRNTILIDDIKDNFVEIIDVFKISKTDFERFFKLNRRTFRHRSNNYNLEYENLFRTGTIRGVGRGPYESTSTHIYFIVTKDIQGITLRDYFKKILVPIQSYPFDGPSVDDKIKEIIEILFELIYGLYILNHRLDIIHNDIHFGNVIFKENDSLPNKRYTINNIDIFRPRKHRLCIYDFDLSYLSGHSNPGITYPDNNIYGRINNPISVLERGRDIYNIGNEIIGFPKVYPRLGLAGYKSIFENTSSSFVNIVKLLFDSDYIINNLKTAGELEEDGIPGHFWNRYCNTLPKEDYRYYGETVCDPLREDFDLINPDKVLLRFLKNKTVRENYLNILSIDPVFKKFLKNL
tara:strand:- start:2060 stop:3634 length:1575 start_codon:yes stop_codon:yes gene_type:complete